MKAGQTRTQSTKTSSSRQHKSTKPDSQNTHLLKPDQTQNFPSIPTNLCMKSNHWDLQNYPQTNQPSSTDHRGKPWKQVRQEPKVPKQAPIDGTKQQNQILKTPIVLSPTKLKTFPSIPSNLRIKSNHRDSQNYPRTNQSIRKHRTSRPVWCRDEEEGEGLEEDEDDSSPPVPATGMRSSRSLSLSLLPSAIAAFSSPITRCPRTTPSPNSRTRKEEQQPRETQYRQSEQERDFSQFQVHESERRELSFCLSLSPLLFSGGLLCFLILGFPLF